MVSSRLVRLLSVGQVFLLVLLPGPALEAGPRTAVLLSEADYPAFEVVGTDADKAKFSVQPFDAPGMKALLRIETTAACTSSYSAQLTARNKQPIQKGDVLLLHFYLRTIKSDLESQEGVTEVILEDATSYDKSLQFGATALEDWKEYLIPFVSGADFQPGQAALNFRVGYDPQIIEIAGLTVTNFGPRDGLDEVAAQGVRLEYDGMAPDAPWRKAAADRIETFRKAELKISVVDGRGDPVPDATLSVNQIRHSYWFGSAVRSDHLVQPQNPEAERLYRSAVREMFNAVTFENALKWPFWQRNFPATQASTAWLQSEGIALRGHALVWPSRKKGLPQSLYALTEDPAQLKKAIIGHIQEITGRVRPPAAAWDVVNEAFNHHEFMDMLGDEAMVDWFRAAREGSPPSLLFINDWGIVTSRGLDTRHQDAYAKTISFLLENQAPLDGIGMQGHFGRELTDPGQILRVLDRFGEFGKEIQMTEYSSQFSDPKDAAAYLRDCLTVFFSHPATSGFILWGFREGVGMPHKGFLLDKNGDLTPSGRVWRDLIFHQWRTTATATTTPEGSAAVRGFLGDYRVTVEKNGLVAAREVKLARGGTAARIVLQETPENNESRSVDDVRPTRLNDESSERPVQSR